VNYDGKGYAEEPVEVIDLWSRQNGWNSFKEDARLTKEFFSDSTEHRPKN